MNTDIEESKKNEIINAMMNVEFYPEVLLEDETLNSYQKISIGEIAAIGGVAAAVPGIVNTFIGAAKVGDQGLYRLVKSD